jgi:hypothetical protein
MLIHLLFQESEFNLKATNDKVELEDLLPSLEDTTGFADLKKKLESLSSHKQQVGKPLSAPVKERLARKVCNFARLIISQRFS